MKALIEELKKLKRLDVYVEFMGEEDNLWTDTASEQSDMGDYVRWDDIADLIKKFEGETK